MSEKTSGELLADMLSRDDMNLTEIAAAIEDDVLRRLYDAADYQADTLDSLVKDAGLRWDCLACSWTMPARDTTCERCHRTREDVGEAPL